MSNDPLETNRKLWDHWADLHQDAPGLYPVEEFLAGDCALNPLDVELVGEVEGLRLLHPQCHFGMDTLSLARRGAQVTGVDFSPHAIGYARQLAKQAGIEATFIESRVDDLPASLDEQFDLVFTTAGVTPWLPDLKAWASCLARTLLPGGKMLLRDFHPFANLFEDGEGAIAKGRYFYEPIGRTFSGTGSYAAAGDGQSWESIEWYHTLSDIIRALLQAGFILEDLQEYPYSTYQHLDFLTEVTPGRWEATDIPGGFPLMYSLRVRKP